ncbi:unnamed protein product, partial [Scytosiphon promiscuus]
KEGGNGKRNNKEKRKGKGTGKGRGMRPRKTTKGRPMWTAKEGEYYRMRRKGGDGQGSSVAEENKILQNPPRFG